MPTEKTNAPESESLSRKMILFVLFISAVPLVAMNIVVIIYELLLG